MFRVFLLSGLLSVYSQMQVNHIQMSLWKVFVQASMVGWKPAP